MARTESYKRWSAEEVSFLRANYTNMTADEIAEALDRTPDSVWEKSGREGLRKHAKRHERDLDGPWYCPKCGKTKPKDEFNVNKDGRGSAYCTSCTNTAAKEKRNKKNG